MNQHSPAFITEYFKQYYFDMLSKKADFDHTSPNIQCERIDDAVDHVLLLVIDSYRSDDLPNVPSLEMSKGIAPSTWTFPSVTSFHTGKYPHDHGAVVHTYPNVGDVSIPEQANYQVLPDYLEAAGFETFFETGLLMPFLAVKEWYQVHRLQEHENAEIILDDYLKWRSDRDRTFSYVHLSDLHAPIEPPSNYEERYGVNTKIDKIRWNERYTNGDEETTEFQEFRENKLRLYNAARKYTHDQLKQFIPKILDNTLIFVIGDHGEAFWEHCKEDEYLDKSYPRYCLGHGGTPFDTVARVPIGVSSPNNEFTLKGGWPSLIDIPRNIAEQTIQNNPFNGELWTQKLPEDRACLCEAPRYGNERKAAYQGNFKLIKCNGSNTEISARIDQNSESFEKIPSDTHEQLERKLDGITSTGDSHDDHSNLVNEQLKALGYK